MANSKGRPGMLFGAVGEQRPESAFLTQRRTTGACGHPSEEPHPAAVYVRTDDLLTRPSASHSVAPRGGYRSEDLRRRGGNAFGDAGSAGSC